MSRRILVRSLLVAGVACGVVQARAENYVGVIYAPPPGFDGLEVRGAGENGLMAGVLKKLGDQGKAGYMTPQGLKVLPSTGFVDVSLADTFGGYHCGSAYAVGLNDALRALFWVGGGAPTNLHPGSPYKKSQALGLFNQIQVGRVQHSTTEDWKACMWSRTAASFRLLAAPNHKNTSAQGTDGVRYVGVGEPLANMATRALLWPAATANAIDLHPSGTPYIATQAKSISGDIQVGSGLTGLVGFEPPHALLWRGSAQSCVELQPSAFDASDALCARGNLQVGWASPKNSPRNQAIAWHGSAASWINLHFKLPPAFHYWHSYATDIDSLGNVVGYVESGIVRRPVIWYRTS